MRTKTMPHITTRRRSTADKSPVPTSTFVGGVSFTPLKMAANDGVGTAEVTTDCAVGGVDGHDCDGGDGGGGDELIVQAALSTGA